MRKIVYLIDQPLDERNYARFGIQAWVATGWEVEVWDLTALAYPHVWQDFIASGRELSGFAGYFPLASKRQLDDKCTRIGKVGHFVDLTGESYYSIRTKMRLIRSGAKRIVCATGSIPNGSDLGQKAGLTRKLTNMLAQGGIKFTKSLGNELVCRLASPFIRPGLSVISGEKSLRQALATGGAQEILRAHNLDYDIFLRLRKPTLTQSGNGVFLDQNICFAPNLLCGNTTPYATPDKYFPAVCNGLRRISGVLRLPVRIAAHPRLPTQREYVDHFQGLPIDYGRTAELVSQCNFVVCHYSTAIQFAVLFRKPIIFVTTDQLSCSPAKGFIEGFASALGKSVINLDGHLDGVDWHRELSLDATKYAEYRNDYIKMDGSPEIPHWDIVIDHIANAAGRAAAGSPQRRVGAGGYR
jgi:hypothetical protein